MECDQQMSIPLETPHCTRMTQRACSCPRLSFPAPQSLTTSSHLTIQTQGSSYHSQIKIAKPPVTPMIQCEILPAYLSLAADRLLTISRLLRTTSILREQSKPGLPFPGRKRSTDSGV